MTMKHLPPMLVASISAVLFSASWPAIAQESSQQPVLTIKADAREVILPVTVRDKKGQIVSGLKQDDFTLSEDSRPQVIKSFTNPATLPLRLGLLIDTSRSQQGAIEGERSASGKFIDQMLARPTDKAFLLHFDREVELLQDFTSSKDKLHHELEEMSTTKGGSGGDREPQVSGGSGDDEEQGRRGHGGGTQMYDAIYLAATELMSSQPGRKAIIVLSDGVDRGSRESLSDAVDAAEKANLSVYTIYFKGEEEHHGFEQGGGGHHGGMGGGGYPGGGGGYPGGGRRGGQSPQSGEAHVDGKKIMEQIATRTGGRFFEAKKKDSFDELYAQITEELHGQYLLTYTPDKPSDSDDGFHKIALKAKNDQLTVFTREGYYTPAK